MAMSRRVSRAEKPDFVVVDKIILIDLTVAGIIGYDRTMGMIKKLLQLFWTFFKIGAFTFGGGYAMISIIEDEVTEKHKWLTKKEMSDIVAIAESTPGAISLNISTFVGTKVAGFGGSLIATIALMVPPIAIISIISLFIDKLGGIQWIAWAMQGVRACVVVLIFNAFLKFFKKMKKVKYCWLLLIASLSVSLFTSFKVEYMIYIAAAIGVITVAIVQLVTIRRAKK